MKTPLNNMQIFIDFDDVIFNTKKFREDLAKIFSAYGISREKYESSYYDPNDERSIKMHDMGDQIQRLKKNHVFDERDLRKSLNDFMQDSSSYVFLDVIPFINLHKKDSLCILSFGNKIFQKKKIRSSKIQNHIADIAITSKDKARTLTDMFKEREKILKEKIIFLDDRMEQICGIKKKFPNIVTILIKRPEGRFQDKKNKYCDFEAHNFKEAQKIIKSLPR
jgi:FMN phosphatase YigB (HAD superfamily)